MHHSKLLAQRDDCQLVIIDIQTRLAAAMAEAERAQVLKQASLLSQTAQLLEIPIAISEQYPRGLGHTEEQLAQHFPETRATVEKTCFSCAASDDFSAVVEKQHRSQLIIAGMETHVCVLQSALEFQARGQQVFVVEDAVCSRNRAHHDNAIARMREAGIIITNTESVLFEWLRDAKHEHFKTVSALIK